MSEVLSSSPESEGEFLFYMAPDGAVKVEVFCRDETVWLTQKALAALFGVQVPAIAKHLKNIFESGELQREATVSKMEIVQTESQRRVIREVEFYNLDAIIAVGYRVNSFLELSCSSGERQGQCPRGKAEGRRRIRNFPDAPGC